MKQRIFIISQLTALALLMGAVGAHAGGSPKTKAEFAQLPPYCKARLAGTNAEKAYWESRLGGDFIHVHHYCNGLNLLNQASRIMGSKKKNQVLLSAIHEMEYVRKHASPNFLLHPEISYKIGNAYLWIGNNTKASREFRTGVRQNPKYPANYIALSNIYKRQSDLEEAKRVLEAGLQQNPKSKRLKRRLERLNAD